MLLVVRVDDFQLELVAFAADETGAVHAEVVVDLDNLAAGVPGRFDGDDEHLVPVLRRLAFLLLSRHEGDEAGDVVELVGVGGFVEGGQVGFPAVVDLIVLEESVQVVVETYHQHRLGYVQFEGVVHHVVVAGQRQLGRVDGVLHVDLLGGDGGQGEDAGGTLEIGGVLVGHEPVEVGVLEPCGLHDGVGGGKGCHADGVALEEVVVVAVEDVELCQADVCHGTVAVLQLEVQSLAAWIAALLPRERVGEVLGMCLVVAYDFGAKLGGQADEYVVRVVLGPAFRVLDGAVADGEPLGGDGLRLGIVVVGWVYVGVVVGVGVERAVELIDAELERLEGVAHEIVDEETEVEARAGVVAHVGKDEESLVAVELRHEVAHDRGVGLGVGEATQVGHVRACQHGVAYGIGFRGDVIGLVGLGDDVGFRHHLDTQRGRVVVARQQCEQCRT